MPKGNKLLQAVEAVHAAGLDETHWPSALSCITQLVGGVGTTLEAIDKASMRLTDFWSHGVPLGSELEYIEHFAAISPRVALGFTQGASAIGYDYMLLDDAAIDRDPYYTDFLRRVGMRYFVSSILTRTLDEFSVVAVQRAPHQGHVGKREIGLMRTLMPHLQQAFDVTRRLREAGRKSQHIADTLDWLTAGAALLRADGTILFANRALRAIAKAGDGIRIAANRLEFATVEAADKAARAISDASGLRAGNMHSRAHPDFPVERPSRAPPYLVSVRPLVGASRKVRTRQDADAVLFVRDPSQQDTSAIELLRELFGLTAAEAHLARALQSGMPLAEYARLHRLSVNTVYTHLRRIKEKTQTKRLAELIQKLKGLEIPVHGIER